MKIDGSTQLAGVFGSPIAHTASPAMHNAAFTSLKMNWCYIACHVDPANLRAALAGIRDMNFRGVNLTVPHKILALDFVDSVEPEARQLGAVNTIINESGKLRGCNTDGYGFAKALQDDFDLELKGLRILILGAGGAGRALAIQSALAGAAKIIVANRTAGKTDAIAAEVTKTKTGFATTSLDGVGKLLKEVDLLVNATSVGLKDGESLAIPAEAFHKNLAVYDTIYRPAETELLRQAAAAGAKVSNGLSMLLHQGARAFELWTQRTAPVSVMRRALRTAVYGEKK